MNHQDLSVEDDVLLWGAHAFILRLGQESILQDLHCGDPGGFEDEDGSKELCNGLQWMATSRLWYKAGQHSGSTRSSVQEYTRTLAVNTAKLQNLTRRVESMESGGFYTQLEFDLLKLEIRELMSLTGQLVAFLNGNNSMIDQLYTEILNMSQAVDQLESLDKHNLLAIRREIVTLKKRLQDCEEHRHSQTPTSVDYGSCDHNGLLNVSNPMVIQLNWRGFSYKYGGWGRGSAPNSSEGEVYWVAPLNTDWRTFDSFRFYYSHDDLLLSNNPTAKSFPYSCYSSYYTYRGQESGMVLYNNSLYYNCYNSRYMCRFNIDTVVI
ncbi:olfactomedin-4-like [Scyliorhinus canicula]|uniref:olfactomedin-4-like n=1 Tax=Scyliorhinus canicula TaxID=7830 RepID=UPI0018F5D4CB|nr:olfactomedin-4-like [Scyliorhinus canicula]